MSQFISILKRLYFTFLVIAGTSSILLYQNCGRSRLGFNEGISKSLGNGILGTDPDTDGDGLSDTKENELGTNPNKEDTDSDGLKDGAEVNTYGTDPLKADTDDGGVNDGAEIARGTDPLDPKDDVTVNDDDKDNDGDGLTNKEEKDLGTDKNNPDTDGDGLKDGEEVNTHHTNPLDPDTDDGGVTDGAEVARGTDPLKSDDDFPAVSDDPDQDGLTNSQEATLGTNPIDPDTDGDGLKDGEEVNTYHTNPLVRDTDTGGIEDGDEVTRGTNPLDPSDDKPIDPTLDTDKDGLTDKEEIETYHTDPNDADTDKDGLSDGAEVNTHHTDPLDPDMDDGGVVDGVEITRGTNPIDNPNDDFPEVFVDTDKDGLTDKEEATFGTDPNNPDSDNDKLPDGAEVHTYHTNPLDPDTDDGGVYDGIEVVLGGNPLDASDDYKFDENRDTDGDGLTDKIERQIGTDPNKPDTDGDGLRDGEEVNTHRTNPLDADTDQGGINDGAEVNRGTNPLNASDDQPLVSQCKRVKNFGFWLDPNNTKDIARAEYIGPISVYKGALSAANNYGYASASAHPKVGPQPEKNQFKAFLYQGSDGLHVTMFAGEDNKGDNRWQPASFRITTSGNMLADVVRLSDDAKELKLVEVKDDNKVYYSQLRYINNTDGGVIGPFVSDNFQIHFEFNNTQEWEGASFISEDKVYSLGKGGAVKNFIIGYRNEVVCEDQGANLELIFRKAPDFLTEEMHGEFIFEEANANSKEKFECALDNNNYQDCAELSPVVFTDFGAGVHKFSVMVTPEKGQPVVFEYKWEIIKPVVTPTPPIWSPWSPWVDTSLCESGYKTQERTRLCQQVDSNYSDIIGTTTDSSQLSCAVINVNCSVNPGHSCCQPVQAVCEGRPERQLRKVKCNTPKTCTPESRKSCQTNVGSGFQTCNSAGSGYGACYLTKCTTGYILQDGVCLPEPKPVPVNGGWTEWKWGAWSDSAYSCGTRTATRTCTNPTPAFGGAQCLGQSSSTETVPCAQRTVCGSYGNWMPVGSCFRIHYDDSPMQNIERYRTCIVYEGSRELRRYNQVQTSRGGCTRFGGVNNYNGGDGGMNGNAHTGEVGSPAGTPNPDGPGGGGYDPTPN